MSDRPDISIIGPGKVGTALGVLAARANWQVVALGARDDQKAQTAVEAIGPKTKPCCPEEAAGAGKLVLLFPIRK